MSGHSQGPWGVDIVETARPRKARFVFVDTHAGVQYLDCTNTGETDVESLANAHLIAAAPEYHSAAGALLARHDLAARNANFATCGCDDCKPFRALYAKAEGK